MAKKNKHWYIREEIWLNGANYKVGIDESLPTPLSQSPVCEG